jgi:hypothetical protein
MAIGDTFSLVKTTSIPNGATSRLLHFLLPAGVIDSVRIKLEGANASDDVVFNFYVDGVAVTTTELTVLDTTNEIEATGLAETVTNDQFGTISIDAPFVSGSLSGVTAIGVHVTYVTQSVNLTGAQTVAGDKTFTGATDFGGATSLELPNSAAPTVNADGEIAVDTTVADFSHGIVKVYAGEEIALVALPIAELTTPTDGHVVAYNATNDEFELVAQTGGGGVSDGDKGDITVSSSGTVWTIDNDVVTYAKLQNISATDRLLGRDTASAGDAEELTVGGGVEFTGSGGIQRSALTGDVTASAGSGSTTIANNAVTTAKILDANVTLAKIANAGANSKLLGSGAAGSGAPYAEITLGTGLSMSGTTLNSSGGSTVSGGSFDIDCGDATGGGDFVINCGDAT